MTMRVALLLCALSLLLVGCDPVAMRNVSLRFSPPGVRQTVVVSTDQADVQEALNLIDSVMISKGMLRDAPPTDVNETGCIAVFRNPKRPMGCHVFIKDNVLYIAFIERGRSYPSREVKQICDLLYAKLSSHYGTERVKESSKGIN